MELYFINIFWCFGVFFQESKPTLKGWTHCTVSCRNTECILLKVLQDNTRRFLSLLKPVETLWPCDVALFVRVRAPAVCCTAGLPQVTDSHCFQRVIRSGSQSYCWFHWHDPSHLISCVLKFPQNQINLVILRWCTFKPVEILYVLGSKDRWSEVKHKMRWKLKCSCEKLGHCSSNIELE